MVRLASILMVGTAHAKLCHVDRLCSRLCPPYGLRCVSCYFNLSWTLASADIRHSSKQRHGLSTAALHRVVMVLLLVVPAEAGTRWLEGPVPAWRVRGTVWRSGSPLALRRRERERESRGRGPAVLMHCGCCGRRAGHDRRNRKSPETPRCRRSRS